MYSSAFRMPKVKEYPYRDIWPVDQHSVSVIPEWLYTYLTNKGLGADYLLTDLVLDEKLSVEDIATIIYINDYIYDQDEYRNIPRLSTYQLCDEITRSRPSSGTFNVERLKSRIRSAFNISCNETIKRDVATRLGGICNENQPSYEFIVTGPKIWLIVKTGFLEVFKDSTSRLSFYRDYLSTVGKIAPSRAVTHTAVFSKWVDELVG